MTLKHKLDYQTMYTKKHIKLLNQWGKLTVFFLMYKFKLKNDYSRELLKEIVKDFENVFFLNPDVICIEGRELEKCIIKNDARKKYKRVRKIINFVD